MSFKISLLSEGKFIIWLDCDNETPEKEHSSNVETEHA